MTTPTQKSGKRLWRTALRVFLTIGLAVAAVYFVDVKAAVAALLRATPAPIAGAVLFYLAGIFAVARRWQIILRDDGAQLPVFALFRIHLESHFVGLALPSSVGADVYRLVQVQARLPGLRHAAVNVLADRLVGALGLLLFGCFGLLLHTTSGVPLEFRIGIVVVLLAGTALGFVFADRALAFIGGTGWGGPIAARLEPGFRQLKAHLSDAPKAVRLICWSLVAHLTMVMTTYFCALGMGVPLPVTFYITILPALWLLAFVPTLGGIGPKEGGLVVAMVAQGIDQETASAVALANLGVRIFASMFGGLGLLLSKRSTVPPSTEP